MLPFRASSYRFSLALWLLHDLLLPSSDLCPKWEICYSKIIYLLHKSIYSLTKVYWVPITRHWMCTESGFFDSEYAEQKQVALRGWGSQQVLLAGVHSDFLHLMSTSTLKVDGHFVSHRFKFMPLGKANKEVVTCSPW